MMQRFKPLLLLVLLLALTVTAAVSPVGDWLTEGVAWIESHPGIAWLAFIVAYICAAVLVLPGSILTVAAGFLFGLPIGVVLVSAGSVLGAAAAFLVGRFFARDWVAARIARLPRFNALDAAARRDGFLIVLLSRLSPLFPFNLLNYGFGLTGVRFRDYVLASWIGMLPATIVYVYVGTLAKDVAELTAGRTEGGAGGIALLVVGFVATVLLTVLITRKATRALSAQLERPQDV